MDYGALKQELTTDPASIGYAAMTDAQAATAINIANTLGPVVQVSIADLVTYLRLQQAWLPIKSSTNPAALAAIDLYGDPRVDLLDVTTTLVQALLGELVAANLLTSAQLTAITAMGKPLISRAQFIGWTVPPSDVDVLSARGA